MRVPLILCAVVVARAFANEFEEDDVQQVQQFAKSVKGGQGGNWQYNPGSNLVSLFGNQTQQGQAQGSWNHNQQGSYQGAANQNQHGQGQASWSQTQQGQGQSSYNQNQHGQSQGSWNQNQSGQNQTSWNQNQGGQSQGSWAGGQQGQAEGNWAQNQHGQSQGSWNQVQGGQGNWNQNQHGQGQNSFNRTGDGYWRHNLSQPQDLEIGVCYIEVPTVRLAKDPQHVPAGNGSRPDLSIIRSCCHGYIRNIHNFRKCDPVCTEECVNGLCSAPETCTCFPDHVKNLAGFCIPTCPIGCQNGQCEGGRCVCKEGYKLSTDSRFCVPLCQENCGGIGNCTAPNTCECKTGYQTTKEGSCKPFCDKCTNGDCVAPNECKCHNGYEKNKDGYCELQCKIGYEATPQGCKLVCHGCAHGDCVGPNQCRCHDGYVSQQGRCVPLCTPECGLTSRCVSPNVCDPPRPVQVYHQPANSSQPLYPDSQRGDISPGHVPDGVPQCSRPCLNGVCAGNNQCHCNPGYVLDKNDASGTVCVPHCSGGCVNGVCSAPNFCICNMGYYKDHSVKGHPSCVKRVRRSAQPLNVADLLVFELPDY